MKEPNWFIRNITGYKTVLRVVFGFVWLVDAILKWLPAFPKEFELLISAAIVGQPSWLVPWFVFWRNVTAVDPYGFAYMIAIVETLLALAVLFGLARKVSYYIGVVFSLLIWSVPDAFGQFWLPGGTDVGASIIYAIVFLFLILVNGVFGPSKYSLDYYLEKKIKWWERVAEINPGAITRISVSK